jgi:hypothetical protein
MKKLVLKSHFRNEAFLQILSKIIHIVLQSIQKFLDMITVRSRMMAGDRKQQQGFIIVLYKLAASTER